ncbi:MAG: hypothetical protein K0Q74_1567 [Gammaproteobacteria bacterium]|nr:hypothetical protein [Gammaproteobacteria bacterium]
MRWLAIVSASMGILSIGWASIQAATQSESPEVHMCNAVLNKGIENNYEYLSDASRYDLINNQLCSANFQSYDQFENNSRSLGINISSAQAILGLSGSKSQMNSSFSEVYQKFCNTSYSEYHNRDLLRTKTSEISRDLINGWNECIKTHLKNRPTANYLSYVPTGYPGKYTLILHQVRNSSEIRPVEVLGIYPKDEVACYLSDGKPISSGNKFYRTKLAMECNVQSSPFDRSIVIDTQEGPTNKLIIPGDTDRLNELNAVLDEHSGKLNTLSAEVNKIKKEQDTSITETKSIIEEQRGKLSKEIKDTYTKCTEIRADSLVSGNVNKPPKDDPGRYFALRLHSDGVLTIRDLRTEKVIWATNNRN